MFFVFLSVFSSIDVLRFDVREIGERFWGLKKIIGNVDLITDIKY